MVSRRSFLKAIGGSGSAAFLAPAAWASQDEAPVPPGVDLEAIVGAERVAGLRFEPVEREQMREGLDQQIAFYDALRKAELSNDEGPAELFDPRLPGTVVPREHHLARFGAAYPGPPPTDPVDLAFASVADLGQWIRTGQVESVQLTRLYLDRLKRHDESLQCVVTLTEDVAMQQAAQADREISAGRYRGPLHGIPWGAKDLFDTTGIRTTWGAAPFRDRVADRDATVVTKMAEAGAVLVAKLSLGALAYGDRWFDGKTRNPFRTNQGSSGSSAGSAAATAAGCVGFALGTETYGSIGTPSARCGATGFRPTFGRVSRFGAMALCWSLDKVGPICRTAFDCALVLDALCGPDPRDPSTFDVPLDLDMTARVAGMRVGYVKQEFDAQWATPADRRMLDALRALDVELVPVELPEGRFPELIFFLISVEAAAAFDELTRSGRDDEMVWQEAMAWPNTFRSARLFPAVEYFQAKRLRRRAMHQAHALFAGLDAVVAPRRHATLHALTNMTGQPAITIRQAFRDDGTPAGVTLWSGSFQDSKLLLLASALERQLGIASRRPNLDD